MKTLLKILVTTLFTLSYSETEAKIFFEKNFHDFGVIAEEGGEVEHTFLLRNHTTKPIVIVSTHTSCGCSKAFFSREPIMPDSIAEIKVVFNPMNYPGSFARKITIITNDGALEERLLITGNVTPRKKSVEEEYPLLMGGGIRAATNAHAFGYIEHGKEQISTFEIINTSTRTVSLKIENPYSELEFYYPTELAAGAKATINFSCTLPEKSAIYGTRDYSISLVIDGVKAKYPFVINGIAIDSRDENRNNRVQMIALSENFIKFGAVKCTIPKLKHTIEVRNDGEEQLTIRKLELNSAGIRADLEGDTTLKRGEKRTITVELNPSNLPFGAVVEKLRIISNDPKTPVLTIRVSAIVER